MTGPAVQEAPQETLGGTPGPTGTTRPLTGAERLQARIAAIQAKHPVTDHPEPEPEPEGKAVDVEYHAAIATFQAILPVVSTEEWAQQPDGTWLCRQTGESRDTQP